MEGPFKICISASSSIGSIHSGRQPWPHGGLLQRAQGWDYHSQVEPQAHPVPAHLAQKERSVPEGGCRGREGGYEPEEDQGDHREQRRWVELEVWWGVLRKARVLQVAPLGNPVSADVAQEERSLPEGGHRGREGGYEP